MEKKKKLIILGIIALTLVIIGTTYAILTWTSTKINLGLNSGCFTIDYTKGQDISGNLKLLNESDLISSNKFTIKNGIGISAVNIGINSNCTIEGYGSIYLNVTNISEAFTTGDSKGALKYAVLSNTSTITTPSSVTVDSLLNQSFEIVAKGSIESSGKKLLYKMELSNTEINKYIIVIYVDNALAGNSITSATFSGNISSEAGQLVPTPDECFVLGNKDETNKTASITDYLCNEGNSYGYEAIIDVVIPEKINGYKITEIADATEYRCMSNQGSCAFMRKGIISIIIPYTITSIGNQAFYHNQLSKIIIPASVTTIGWQAFTGNPLTYIIVDSNNKIYDSRNNSNAIIETSSNKLIQGSRNTIIPNTVTAIGNSAFDSVKLTSITIPDSVTTIGNNAFQFSGLEKLILSKSLTVINSLAFANNQLASVTIPDSVTTIGGYAFEDNRLDYILINSNSNLETIGSHAFNSSKESNSNLKIYNNSGKAFDWNKAVNGTSGTAFVTGTTNTTGNYNAVTVTTGQPS